MKGRFLLASLLLLTAGGLGWMVHRQTLPTRIDLLFDPEPWQGLSPEEVRGLRLAMSDHLETFGDATITQEGDEAPLSDRMVRVRVSGQRTSAGLRLHAVMTRAGGSSQEVHCVESDPTQALHRVVDMILSRWWSGRDALDPSRPDDFWPICQALDAPYHAPGDRLRQHLDTIDGLSRRDASGLARFAGAHLRYRLLLDDSGAGDPGGTGWCEEGFQEALRSLPNCPRLAMLYANFRTDVGDQRTALDLLFALSDRKPHDAGLHDSLAYAARTLGLLDGAKRAIRRRDQLGGHVGQAYFLAENTYLYSGDWIAFEQSLQAGVHEPVQDFYRGYAALLRKDTEEARSHFQHAIQHEDGIKVFKRLSAVYLKALQGRKAEALADLRALDENRVSVKVPDGEFTFKLAEAYAFLGRNAESLEMARRAFSQGFICAEWYGKSPFLAPLRGEPQWEAFLTGLRERQQRMEQRFPADRFGK